MKKKAISTFKNVLSLNLWVLASVVSFCACSNDHKMYALLKQIPSDADVVVVGNVKTVLESAGGSINDSKIKLPSEIKDKIHGSDFDDFNDFLKDAGVDLDACAMIFTYKDNSYPVCIFALNDKKKFVKAIEAEDFNEKDNEDNIVFYAKKTYESDYDDDKKYTHIAISDDYAYMIQDVWKNSDFKPERAIKKLISYAEKDDFAGTAFGNYITSGNAVGIAARIPKELRSEMSRAGVPSSLREMYNGVVCFKGTLTKEDAVVDMAFFDEDGKKKDISVLEKFANFDTKVNANALAYMGKNDFFVAAASLKDFKWDKVFESVADANGFSRSDRAQISVLTSYLEKIDGTVAYGLGLTNGMESIYDLAAYNIEGLLSVTCVVETKQGKARTIVNDLKGLLESQQIPFADSSNGFTLNIPDTEIKVYVQAVENFVVLANHEISKTNENPALKAVNFAEYVSAAALVLDKNNKLMHDLDVDNDVIVTLAADKPFEGTMRLSVKGGNSSDGVLAKLIKVVVGIADQADKIEQRVDERRREAYGNAYDYVQQDDMYAIDTVIVDDSDYAY